jgi:serine phosphatase RsbU (regulator of sigma subunit)
MRRKLISAILVFVFSSVHALLPGQDTLSVKRNLKMAREADSVLAAGYFKIAANLFQSGHADSAEIYTGKSFEIASSSGFILLEATNYELLASIYERRSDWEKTLFNYLGASSAYKKLGDKTHEARILKIIAGKYYDAGIYKMSAWYSEQEFLLYDEQSYGNLASASEMAGKAYFFLPSDSLSSYWYNAASHFYEETADSAGYIRCTEKIGSLFTQLGLYEQARRIINKLLSVYNYRKDYKNLARIYNQSGFLDFRMHSLGNALSNFRKAAEFSDKGGKDDQFLTDVWSNIAICFQNLGDQKEMLQSFGKALQYARVSGRTGEVARIERIMAMIYFKKGDNYHAEVYCLECIGSAKASGNLEVLQLCYLDYSNVLESGNDFMKALDYYERNLTLRDSLNYAARLSEKEAADRITEFESADQKLRSELVTREIEGLEMKTLRAESSRRENEYKLLLKQQELDRSEKYRLEQSLALERDRFELTRRQQEVTSLQAQQVKDSLLLRIKNDEAKSLETANQLLETEKKQVELKAEKEKQIRKMAVGLGVLMVLVALMILFGLISTRKKNQKLAESKSHIEKINADLELTNTEVLKQKDIIEQKNQSITDSIQYASRIQTAVLPPISFLADWGIDNFILFKPKDIVSGDFYWGKKKTGKIIIAAGDCTGHGVPGAFMSMLGHAFLDEIVNTREIENAATILNILRDEIIGTLKQKGTTGEARDGMDISLVILDPVASKLDYAGANNPLYIIRDGKLLKYKADRMPIGIHFISHTPFTNNSIGIKKGDYIYLFSDGFADQFGGPQGKKFMYKPFQELLLSNHRKALELQKEILNNTFEKWKGDREQVDDVMIIGMHI